jgi:hypothetical protein
MLQSELQERIGMQLTVEQYNIANAIYMQTTIDKDEFAKEYLQPVKDSKAVTDYVSFAESQFRVKEAEIKELKQKIKDLQVNKAKELEDVAYYLMDSFMQLVKSQELVKPEAIEQIALKHLGKKEYLKYKLSNNIALSDADKNLLLEIL